jgi:hypothetical protein
MNYMLNQYNMNHILGYGKLNHWNYSFPSFFCLPSIHLQDSSGFSPRFTPWASNLFWQGTTPSLRAISRAARVKATSGQSNRLNYFVIFVVYT